MTHDPKFRIKSAVTPSDLTAIRHLFTAYALSLGIDLSFQTSPPNWTHFPVSTILLLARCSLLSDLIMRQLDAGAFDPYQILKKESYPGMVMGIGTGRRSVR